jgi:hypothetical protein
MAAESPVSAGAATARQIITRQAEAGMAVEAIVARSGDLAAGLFADAQDAGRRAFADGFALEADTLCAELRAMDREAGQ